MKKVLLLPMMLMGVALSFTSCGDNDDPGKDPDVVTYDFKNLPADSGAKPTEDQSDLKPMFTTTSRLFIAITVPSTTSWSFTLFKEPS